tara:strand:+ start:446 stop:910 length:465 start_codon:yes stop_codon:yes gene_type:complete
MNATYLPTEIFNLIKEYANIDPVKHNQKKYMKLVELQIRRDKWGIYGFDMEEARMVKSKIYKWGGEYLYGYEELHEQGIMNLNDLWEEYDIEPAETGVYRNKAWNYEHIEGEYDFYYHFEEEMEYARFLENQKDEYLNYLEMVNDLPKRCLIKL